MPDECPLCGGRYATYGEGHTPGGVICLRNQIINLKKQLKQAKKDALREAAEIASNVPVDKARCDILQLTTQAYEEGIEAVYNAILTRAEQLEKGQ